MLYIICINRYLLSAWVALGGVIVGCHVTKMSGTTKQQVELTSKNAFINHSLHLSNTKTTIMNGYNEPTTGAGGAAGAGVVIPTGPTNQPRILVRKLDRDETTFHLSGVDLAYANSLRRTMMADVPTVGGYSFTLGWGLGLD